MKKIFIGFVYIMIFVFCSWSQNAQESIVDTFIANFKRANPDIKLQVLRDADEMDMPGMGPLFLEAIDFILSNANQLDANPAYRKISSFAVAAIKKQKFEKARNSLWNLFKADSNTQVRVGVLESLAEIAAGDTKLINNINTWLETQNSTFKSGQTPDLLVIYTCVEALGKLGDASSFPALFRALLLKYSNSIFAKTDESIKMLKGDLKQLYITIIMNGIFEEKKFALTRVMNDKNFSDTDKCEVAELTLNIALNTVLNSAEEKDLSRQTRYLVVNFLGEKKWSNSTQLLITHFNQVIMDMDRGIATKSDLIEAINTLGKMKNHEAAKRLTLYLDLINSYTENGKVYDEQIVLAVIDSLGNLGDMVANGTLLYTKYLNYSETVKKAVTSAIKNLK